jgi:NSS family neurotransmitter:Na+ symporter
MPAQNDRGKWSSNFGFILAAAGSAIGLGNIWRFPYMVGQNGGAAFVVVYLICIFIIGFPIMLAELAIGRAAQKNPVGAFKALAPGTSWKYLGHMMVIVVLIVFSWYSVVSGWIIGYFYKTLIGTFANNVAPGQTQAIFQDFVSNPGTVMFLALLFIAMSGYVVLGGVRSGIERLSRVLMPVLLIILILLAVRSVTLPGAMKGVVFYLNPDFTKINGGVIAAAMGQAFLSLSVGAGTILTFGSYLSKRDNIPMSTTWVCSLDTGIALLAGFIILPAVAALGQEFGAGPELIFQVLPSVFAAMPGGQLFGVGLFLLLIIAALTSSVSQLEVPVAYLVDERKWTRKKAVIALCFVAFVLGIPAALSAGASDFFTHLPGIGTDFLSFISAISGDIFMVAAAMMMTLFVTFKWTIKKAIEEITVENAHFPQEHFWGILMRFVVPVLILVILWFSVKNSFFA